MGIFDEIIRGTKYGHWIQLNEALLQPRYPNDKQQHGQLQDAMNGLSVMLYEYKHYRFEYCNGSEYVKQLRLSMHPQEYRIYNDTRYQDNLKNTLTRFLSGLGGYTLVAVHHVTF